MHKKTMSNLIKIINCLNQAQDWLWLREIARRSGIPHHTTVERVINKYLQPFVEQQTFEPFNVLMVKLKSPLSVENFLKYLQTMKKSRKHIE